MQKVVKLSLLLALLCLLPCTSIAQKSGRRSRKPSPSPIICNIASVPKGMVVVGYKRNSACSEKFELVVKRAENGDVICAESPVPRQFSIATEAQGDSVGTCPNKAFLITGGRQDSATQIDEPIASAFASGTSNIQVEGEGTVSRVLPDDLNGPRHQRFIVELASGQTLLITHNIDIARESTDLRRATMLALTASMSGTRKAASFIGRITTHEVDMFQGG